MQMNAANNATVTQDQTLTNDHPQAVRMPQEVQVEIVRAEEEESEDDDEDNDEDGESELEMSEYEIVLSGLTPRKRSSQELDVDADAKVDTALRGGSPPKRARVVGSFSPSMVSMTPPPVRLRKRSSEDLEEDGDAVQGNGEHKRSRTESHRSMSASAEVVT